MSDLDRPSLDPTAAPRRRAAGSSLIDPQTLMRIKSLQIRARVAVEGFIKGIHRSPYHGFSVEFSEYREYTPGDDPALSRLAALRPDRPLLRQAVRGRDQPSLLSRARYQPVDGLPLRRLTARANTPARPPPPSPISSRLQRDAVGLVTFEDRITDYLPPRHRPGHLRRLLAMLEREPTRPRDRPGRASRRDRRDGQEARADRPDLRPAGADRLAANPARLPPLAGP